MKIQIIIFLIFSSVALFSQTNISNSISVNGSSSHLVSPKNVKVGFSISDIQPNEYRKTRYKKQSDVFNEFKDKLIQIGITSSLNISNSFQNDFWQNQNQESEYYTIVLKDITDVKKIVKNLNEGVRITSIHYIYDPLSSTVKDNKLSEAIKDAKDKASLIAKKVNKKVGEVITINFLSDYDLPSETTTLFEVLEISINITFELL